MNGDLASKYARNFGYTETSVSRPRAPIEAVRMGNQFRPHVLADIPRLPFTQVNLLEGPNGMGKTSILECIELAFTGDIQRNLLAGLEITEDWDGALEFSGIEESLHGIPSREERKLRETAYYQQKVAPRRDSHLNRAFHQYNYFSSEKIHQFCFNGSQKMDYRGAFARVIFGEQLELYEQCWKGYKAEFQKAQRRLLKEVQQLEEKMNTHHEEYRHEGEILQSRIHTAAAAMVGLLIHVQSSYPHPDTPFETAKVEEWFQHIQPYLQELEFISGTFAKLQMENVDSQSQWITTQKRLMAEELKITERLNKLQDDLKTIPNSDYLEAQLLSLWTEFENQRLQQDVLNGLKDQFSKYEYLYDQTASISLRLQINKKWHELNDLLRPLREVWNVYEPLATIPLLDMTDSEFELKRQKSHETLLEIKGQMVELEQQVQQQKQMSTKLHQLQSELNLSALQYLHIQSEESKCPLCGYDHESADLLLHAITANLKSEDETLSEMLNKTAQLDLQLKASEQLCNQYDREQRLRARLREAGEWLRRNEVMDEALSFAKPFSSQEVQNVLHILNTNLQEILLQQRDTEERGLELEKRGIQLAAIERLEELKKSPELVSYYKSLAKDDDTYYGLNSFLSMIITRNSNEVEQARGKHAQFMKLTADWNKYRERLEIQWNEAQLLRSQSEVAHKQLSGLADAYSRLHEKNIILREEQSWSEWRRGIDKLIQASNRLGEALEPRILLEQKEREHREINEQLSKVGRKLERCVAAVHVLSEIGELAAYGESFVRSNFNAISHMFVSLHSPNEFERLELVGDEMVAVRKGSGTRSYIYQLSTGQRTSVIMAIFFIMHLVMETAPPFLLLDEPVAHMDELNVVGLLDFLRQLTITKGTQLIFTTANPQIAALFRRKFSFLEEQFQVFQLRRDGEGPLQVRIGYFKPYEEKLISLTP